MSCALQQHMALQPAWGTLLLCILKILSIAMRSICREIFTEAPAEKRRKCHVRARGISIWRSCEFRTRLSAHCRHFEGGRGRKKTARCTVSSGIPHLLRFVRIKSQEQKLRFAQRHLQAAFGLQQVDTGKS